MKKDHLTTVVSWVGVGLALLTFFILGCWGGFGIGAVGGGPMGLFGYYVQEFGISFLKCIDQLFLFAFLFAIGLAFYGVVRQFLSISFPDRGFGLPANPFAAVRAGAKRVGLVLLDFLPVLVLLLALSLVFSEANGLDKARLLDVPIMGLEHLLTGTYVFAWLASFHWPHFLIEFIIACFLNVATIVILPALFVGYIDPRVFREMLVAFAIGMMILAACWLAVPALSPHDRFIDNIYSLPIPPDIAATVAHYHPQPEIRDFLSRIRTGKVNLLDLPTSTIPSAHIFWIVLTGYYFFKSRRWLGWIMSPFLLASAIGTVLLAQHYFLDVIASLLVVAASVWVARKLNKGIGARV